MKGSLSGFEGKINDVISNVYKNYEGDLGKIIGGEYLKEQKSENTKNTNEKNEERD